MLNKSKSEMATTSKIRIVCSAFQKSFTAKQSIVPKFQLKLPSTNCLKYGTIRRKEDKVEPVDSFKSPPPVNSASLKNITDKCKKPVPSKPYKSLFTDPEFVRNKLEPVTKNLRDVLHINDIQAKVIIRKYPKFLDRPVSEISLTASYLNSHQIAVHRLLKNPWILLVPEEALRLKVTEVMSILNIRDFEVAVPFVKLSSSKLRDIKALWKAESEYVKTLEDKSRIEFLAAELECSPADIADMMAKMESLATMPFLRIDTVLNILLDGGVRREDIRTDPWIFEHNIERMQERLKSSKERGLSVIKPWILRSPPSIYEYYVSRMIREKVLLQGHKDLGSFLQQKLGCAQISAKEILQRVPSIKTASAIKLNEMIEFLFSQGFDPDHILETPRILGHSVETISQRIKELSSYGYTPVSLSVLCKTSKHYSSFVRRLSKNNTSGKKTAAEE